MIEISVTKWSFDKDHPKNNSSDLYVDLRVTIKNTYFELFPEVMHFIHRLNKLGAFKEDFPMQTEVMVDLAKHLGKLYSPQEMNTSPIFVGDFNYEQDIKAVQFDLKNWEWKPAKKLLKLYGYKPKELKQQSIQSMKKGE